MLERYPTLNANPYALLVKFDDLATPEEVDDLLSQTNSIIVDFYPTVNWYLVETPSGNLNTQKTFEKVQHRGGSINRFRNPSRLS